MIEIKTRDVNTILNSLKLLSKKKLPARESFKVMRMMRHFDEEYKTLVSTYTALFDKYAEKDESGNYSKNSNGLIIVKAEYAAEFSEEVSNLDKTTITLPDDKIPLSLFDDLEFSPSEMASLENIILE